MRQKAWFDYSDLGDHPPAKSLYSFDVYAYLMDTEKEGNGHWRIMVDLNPSMVDRVTQREFGRMLEEVSCDYYEEGTLQGGCYFDIPMLGRTKRVSHFILKISTAATLIILVFAKRFGERVIDTYIGIVLKVLGYYRTYYAAEKVQQLRYHTLYLF